MAKVAVSGGSGFIGSHVVDKLVEAGHEVTVLMHRALPQQADVKFEETDILDFSSLLAATRGMDYVFHLAANPNVNYAFKNPVLNTQLNVMGTNNVLEAARLNGVKRVFLASTVWVFNAAIATEIADETTPISLNGAGHIYTSSKISAEMLCQNYWELYKLPFTIFRFGIAYGPRQRESLLIPIFLKKALTNQPLTVSGKGDQYRKFVYVEDLARAHALAVCDQAVNQTFNLEGNRNVSVLDVAEGIRKLVGEHVKIEFTPARPGDFAGCEIANAKAARVLGWRPEVDFDDGLLRTVDYFCKKWNVSLPGL
ncbi:NAD-dependent epimerase/dehydratase family protein [uncultured Gammaproteobacteria bacterium]